MDPVLGLVMVCVAAMLWGTVGVARGMMPGADEVSPIVIALTRTMLGSAVLLASAWFLGIHGGGRRPPLGALAVFGLAGAIFQISLFEAFGLVGVTATVAITVCAPPLIVELGDALRCRRWPELGLLVAVLLATLGIVLLTGAPAATAVGISSGGVVAVVVASFAFAAVAVASRVIGQTVPSLRGAGLGFASTALVLAGLTAFGHLDELGALVALSGRDLLILGYIGIAGTGAAYLAFVLGMRLCATAAAGLAATMIEPLVAAALAALLLREHLDGFRWTGAALTLIAIFVLSVSQREDGPTT